MGESHLYLRPLGFLYGDAGDAAVAGGLALPLAGGPIAFTVAELIEGEPGRASRRTVSAAALVKERARDAYLAALVARVTARRPSFAGLKLDKPLLMGIVNVTPDSFSDGGAYFDRERAIEHAVTLSALGADIVDIGGESTRPGATVQTPEIAGAPAPASGVSEAEEMERVIPVIRAVKEKAPQVIVSVDTYKAAVARAGVEAGAEIVNDVSGFRWDPAMAKTVGSLRCGAVIAHSRGRPNEWRNLPPAEDIVLLIRRELKQQAEAAVLAGTKRPRVVIDPGFGFGKRFDENYPILRRLEELQSIGFPLLAGVSRKSFLGRTLARDGEDAPVDRRLFGTLAAETAAILSGAHIIRTHDIAASADAVRVADRILR